MIDFSKTPSEIVTQLINSSNGLRLLPTQLAFGTPEANVIPGGKHNTKLAVSGVPAQGTADTVEVRYNRVDIDTVPGNRSRVFAKGALTRVAELVALVNEAYDIQLTAADYVDADLPAVGVPSTLDIQPGSLVWFGQLDYTLSA